MMRRLSAPLASLLGRAVPRLRLRVIVSSRIDLIRAPDDPPSTLPGRTAEDAANDVALEFLRDCDSATTLADVGDEELPALLFVRAGEHWQGGGTKVTSRHSCPEVVAPLVRCLRVRTAARDGSLIVIYPNLAP
jgi:hypothetical protein